MIYGSDQLSDEIRQGEIICDLTQHIYDSEKDEVVALVHPFAVASSQDCDLLRDFEARKSNADHYCNLIFFAAAHAREVRSSGSGLNSDIWRRLTKNDNDRYHFFQRAEPNVDLVEQGFDDLVVDFRGLFTLGAQEVYRQIKKGTATRRCRLLSPYREHFQQRAFGYMQRVGLPEPHVVTPQTLPIAAKP